MKHNNESPTSMTLQIESIGIDIDGVLADFATAAALLHRREDILAPGAWPRNVYQMEDALGITTAEFWSPIEEQGTAFWAELKPYPWMPQLVAAARRIVDDVYLISKPSHHPYSTSGKHRWIRKYFGEHCENYLLTPQKFRAAGPGRLLIDDSQLNVSQWQARGGSAILFPQPWNTGEGDHKTVFEQLARFTAAPPF